MITKKINSFSISRKSINRLGELSKEFHMKRSAIIDKLLQSITAEQAEILIEETEIKLIKLYKEIGV